MNEPLFETNDIWLASVFVFLYSVECLAKIEDHELDNRKRSSTYSVAVPSEDAKIVVEEYESGQLALSDARSFVRAFNSITQRQRAMRLRGDIEWSSPAWIRGEVG